MTELAVTYRGTVYPWHCDHMGHMNVMWYVGKFDEATWQLMASVGLTPDYLRSEGRGTAAVDQRISYRRELHAGDTVVIRSAFLEAKSKVVRFCHRMEHAVTGEICAVTVLTGVHMDTVARKAVPMPDALLEAARKAVVDLDPWE
ncbi:thioesterase family protein [Streptomyces sp. NA02950]|uniref:acyl-CoA thioesterase n=1 Tax=Streptomyces sp. NA02950 TaxID=2742137 RepID=UPI001592AF59|nr:thioesterase family protein [Streptomyces sp. NA02950]QKV96608.1 thioesterase family protein [Streptomyces sp. NA02950]